MKNLFFALLIFCGCYADEIPVRSKTMTTISDAKIFDVLFVLSGNCKEAEIRQLDCDSGRIDFPFVTVFPWEYQHQVIIEPEDRDGEPYYRPFQVSLYGWNRYDVGADGGRANLKAQIYYRENGGEWILYKESTGDGPFCHAIVDGYLNDEEN
jgi:hypothetical protein